MARVRAPQQCGMADYVDVQALCGPFDRRAVSAARFLEACTRLFAAAIGCARVGIWLFEDVAGGCALRCLSVYDGVMDRMTLVPDETSQQVGHVLANDACTHPPKTGFFTDRASLNGVRSSMAVSLSVNDCLFGAFTCTNTRVTEWSPAQPAPLTHMGARVSVARVNSSCTSQFTLPTPL